MDYLSGRVEDASFMENSPERRAFREHLRLIAKALHIIEWNDSGDGADGESEAIRKCLAEGAVLASQVEHARKVAWALNLEIERATSKSKTEQP
jgi:hypothetical protein